MGAVRLVRHRRRRITRRISLWLESKRPMDPSGCVVRMVACVDRWCGIGEPDLVGLGYVGTYALALRRKIPEVGLEA